MKPNLLFPPAFKLIGLTLVVPGLVLWYLFTFQYYVLPFLGDGNNNIFLGMNTLTDELFTTLIIIGFIFIGFSRSKNGLVSSNNIHLKALYWSVLANCILTAGCFLISLLGELCKFATVEKLGFTYVYFYNFFILLLIFIARFYYLLYKAKRGKPINPVYLLPHKPYSIAGKIIGALFILLSIASLMPFLKIGTNSDAFNFILIGVLPFFLLWIWSKEKTENEVVASIRLQAMQIAVYVNCSLFLIATWVFYSGDYILVFSAALVSIQIIFMIVFYFMLYNARRIVQRPAGNVLGLNQNP
ncbi:MAG TPA: hypothetical protein VK668_16765 [Mucilaginibacter sp.]|nr:hypothetical protein [Mucilaginibacter sp.]